MGAAPRTVAVAVPVEDRLQLLLQQHRRRSLRHPVARIGDGDFILPLLQSRAGLDLVCCDRRWPRARAGVVSVPAGTDIAGYSVPLTGPGLAGRRVEVAGLPDPGA